LVVICEFLVVSICQPNEFIPRKGGGSSGGMHLLLEGSRGTCWAQACPLFLRCMSNGGVDDDISGW